MTIQVKKYNSNMDLDSDVELIPINELRWGIDGTRARARVDPKFRSKEQTKYGSGARSRSGVDPHNQLRWDRDWTGAGARVDPLHHPHNELSWDIDGTRAEYTLNLGKKYNPNTALELDPDLEFTPSPPPQWAQVKHKWCWNRSWSRP